MHAQQGDPWKDALESALKDGLRILRIDLADEKHLLSLEDSVKNGLEAKARSGTLISTAPRFEWWGFGGLWPRESGGWIVLLKRVPVQVNVQQAQMPTKP